MEEAGEQGESSVGAWLAVEHDSKVLAASTSLASWAAAVGEESRPVW